MIHFHDAVTKWVTFYLTYSLEVSGERRWGRGTVHKALVVGSVLLLKEVMHKSFLWVMKERQINMYSTL